MERMIVKVPISIITLDENKKSDFIKSVKDCMTKDFLEKYGSLENYNVVFKKVPWSTWRWREEIDKCNHTWETFHWGRYAGPFKSTHTNYRFDGKVFGSESDLVEYFEKYEPFDFVMEASLKNQF